ncbi:MAG: GDP-mannose 4,6-dehydratase [Candidatus Micrarchaeaceae archaeon]
MKDEKLLLTGSTGFIGQKLLSKLAERYEVHTLERYVTGRYTIDRKKVINHYANLSDYNAVRHIVRDIKPDYCVHLAAISAVSFSYEHYIEVSEVNYIGTINLAEACYREAPAFKQFIMAGTSEEYGTELQDKAEMLAESSPLQPNSPYAVAKVAADYYLRYMHEAYGFPYTILRPFNTYGRANNTHFFIERTITQMLANPNGKVYLGNPDAIRDWMYVDDHVEGYLKALGNEKAISETIQLCTGKGYTTTETADIIANLTGFKGTIWWNTTPARPLDAKILIGDNKKARELLDWQPKYSLEEGLKKTIEYLKSG